MVNLVSYLYEKAITLSFILSVIAFSCTPEKIEKINDEEVLKLPQEEWIDLKINYSEQGSKRNYITAALVTRAKNGDSSLYLFPKGLYAMSCIDSVIQSDLRADSASYVDRPSFFTAQGHVVIRNLIKNMRLETEGPLYWDAVKKEIYTDAYTLIIRPPDTIPALYGMVADDAFTNYTLIGIKDAVIYKSSAPDSTKTLRDSSKTISSP